MFFKDDYDPNLKPDSGRSGAFLDQKKKKETLCTILKLVLVSFKRFELQIL